MVRLALVIWGCVVLAACASTGAVPRPFPVPGGAPPSSSPAPLPRRPGTAAVHDGYSISSTALSLQGTPYRNGGSDPAGFDCSGFVKYVFEQNGLKMPREVRKQFEVGHEVESQALAPGDLVFFTTVAPGASHVGIAIGGDQFVHAPSTSGVVRVERLGAQYWSNRFVGAKRVDSP
jgi:NlpC/P60 family